MPVPEKTVETIVTTTTRPAEAEGDDDIELVFMVGEIEIPLSHLTMLKWLIRRSGGIENVKTAIKFLEDHGKIVNQAMRPA